MSRDPRDVTGEKAQLLAEHAAEKLKAREDEISLVSHRKAQEERAPIDLSTDSRIIAVEDPVVEIRVRAKLDQVTIGKNASGDLTFFDFEPGRVYRVPKYIADHLEEKNLLYH